MLQSFDGEMLKFRHAVRAAGAAEPGVMRPGRDFPA
jgi:hypothetical protein